MAVRTLTYYESTVTAHYQLVSRVPDLGDLPPVPEVQLQRVLSGDVDILPNLPPEAYAALTAAVLEAEGLLDA